MRIGVTDIGILDITCRANGSWMKPFGTDALSCAINDRYSSGLNGFGWINAWKRPGLQEAEKYGWLYWSTIY